MKTAVKPAGTSAGQETLRQELKSWRQTLDTAMTEYFKTGTANTGMALGIHEIAAYERLKEFSLRPGKRIRGGLGMFAYDYFGGKNQDTRRKIGVAIELIQNYFLMIDDVMDRSDLRRGKPAAHKIFTKELAGKLPPEDAGHLGEMLAINTALLAQHMASTLLAEVPETPARIIFATKLFHHNILATCYGQIADMYNNVYGEADEQSLIRLHELKNSYYTFINPLQVGAALAGVSKVADIDKLAAIGLPAGVAFQLQDDVLGLFGEEDLTGKPALDDLKEGRFTLLMRYAYERAGKPELKVLKSALGNPKLTRGQHTAVKEIVEACGAKEAVESAARNYCKKAQASLAKCDLFNEESKQFLHNLIEYCVNRKA